MNIKISYKNLLIILFVLNSLIIYAQANLELDTKYWNYRKRLNDKFMIVGEPSDICDNIGGYNLPISSFSHRDENLPQIPRYSENQFYRYFHE